MHKKKIRKIITRTLELVVLGFGVTLLLLQTPFVQTGLARKATLLAEKHLDADIYFSAIKFAPFNTLIIKDMAIIDRHPESELDTVMSAKHISATFSLRGLLAKKGGVHIERLRTKDFNLNLVLTDTSERGYRNNISSIFNTKPKGADTLKTIPDIFSIKRADIDNFHYRMLILNRSSYKYKGHGINWRDLELWADARGHDINFVDGRCSFDVDWLKVHEKCGYSFWGSGHCITGLGLTEVTDTRIMDEWSDVHLKRYTMAYRRNSDWKAFSRKIILEGDATASPLALKSVDAFCGAFEDSPLLLDIETLKLKGPVNSLDISEARLTDRYSGIKADLSVSYKDLSDREKTSIDVESRKFDFSGQGLDRFLSSFTGKEVRLTKALAEDFKADLKGTLRGPLDDLDADLSLTSGAGNITLTAKAQDLLKTDKPLSYNAKIALEDVDLSKTSLGEKFGKTSLHLQSKGSLKRGSSPDIELNKLDISKLTLNNYVYSHIDGSGYFKDNTFTGNIRCNDPNLNFILGGSFSLSSKSKNSIYKFNLVLGYADLAAIKLDPRPGISTLSTSMNISFRKSDKNVLIGDAGISRLTYTDQDGKHNIGDILFASVMDSDKLRINLRSSFADITYSGDPDLGTIVNPLLANSIGRSLPSLLQSGGTNGTGRNFESQIIIKDTKEALSFLRKNVLIAPDTRVRISMDPSGEINASFSSNGIRFENNVIRGLEAKFHALDSNTTLTAGINEVKTGTSGLKKAYLHLKANSDNTCLQVSATDILNKNIALLLDLDSDFSRNQQNGLQISSTLENSFINLDGKIWRCSHPVITYESDLLDIDSLRLWHEGQSIEVNGGASRSKPSKLAINIKDMELSTANLLLKDNLTIAGLLNGKIEVSTPIKTNMGLQVFMECPDFEFGKARVGQITLKAHLDDEDDLFKFSLDNSPVPGQNALKIEGNYNSISNYLNANASFTDFNPGMAQKAVDKFCSNLNGRLNGRITASGPVSDLSIRSNDLTLRDLNLTLIPTGVNYTVNADARFDEQGLIIDRLAIADGNNGQALLKGRPEDLSLHLDRLRVLDKAAGSDDYSGTLALNGDILFSGKDPSHIVLDANLSNAGDGKLNMIMAKTAGQGSDILQFKEKEEKDEVDEFEQKFGFSSPADRKQIDAKCRFSVNPGLEISAFLDREGANVLNVNGEGTVTADFNSKSGNLNMGGNYNITEGKYHFSAIGALIAKDFNIQDGSSLTFAGDVMDTELNISAVHSLKTSIGTLISDTTSVSTRRLVNCGIKISDKLHNPQLAFSIDIPDLDPSTKALVDSELNTEDKVSRQFLSLVVLGSFLPSDQNGIVNNNTSSNFLYSNLASIMSGQLNTILQKFNIPLDLGLTYEQTDMGNNVMDLAVSTQLFDNMVSVNGSVGNRKYSSTSSDENMVGDLDINIKLNKSGHFRLNLFSHSADDYTNYLDNSQRNGVGISYQIEYNSFRSFLRTIFKKEDERSKEVIPTKKIVIKNE